MKHFAFPRLQHTLLLLGVLLAGCMQSTATVSADRPDWLQGEPSQYPNVRYLTATGSAGDAERAKERALANLARIFELRIRESSTSVQEVQSQKQKQAGEETVSTRQQLRQQIQIDTDKIIQGARIAEQWLDRRDATHYALAVLNRRQAGTNLRSVIERLDADTQHQLDKLVGSTPVEQVSRLSAALDLQQQRDALQQTLKIIDRSGQGLPAQWSRAELQDRLQQALSAMRIALAVKQDDVGELAELVSGAMGKAGMPANNRNYAYILTASLHTQPAFQNQGWYWLRGNLSLQLSDAVGKVLGARSWPLKVSSVQQALLKPRMRSKVEKILNSELQSTILGFASGKK